MKVFKSRRAAALTLVETMVAVAVIGVAGAGVFEILRTGTILFGKNTSINLTHSQTRYGLIQLQNDLHNSVSTPELTDGTGTVISGSATGPAAGVSFQSYAAGPMCVYVPSGTTTISGSATSIEVVTGTQGSALDYKPLVGQTLHIQVLPTTLVELQVTAVSGP
jgi:hypothetical protein